MCRDANAYAFASLHVGKSTSQLFGKVLQVYNAFSWFWGKESVALGGLLLVCGKVL